VNSSPIAVGSRGILQAGSSTVANPAPGASKTALEIQTILGKTSERYPRVRVWRTVR
jgi:hypothetical protein